MIGVEVVSKGSYTKPFKDTDIALAILLRTDPQRVFRPYQAHQTIEQFPSRVRQEARCILRLVRASCNSVPPAGMLE